jgi:hypothetical protein
MFTSRWRFDIARRARNGGTMMILAGGAQGGARAAGFARLVCSRGASRAVWRQRSHPTCLALAGVAAGTTTASSTTTRSRSHRRRAARAAWAATGVPSCPSQPKSSMLSTTPASCRSSVVTRATRRPRTSSPTLKATTLLPPAVRHAFDQNTGKLYPYATRGSDGTAGLVCIDTSLPAPASGPDVNRSIDRYRSEGTGR